MKKPRNHAEETARRTRAVYTCTQCGNTFTRLSGRKVKFCSNRCLALDAWRRRREGLLPGKVRQDQEERIQTLLSELFSLTSYRTEPAMVNISKLVKKAEAIANEAVRKTKRNT